MFGDEEDRGCLLCIGGGGPVIFSLEENLGKYEGGPDVGEGGVLSELIVGRPGLEKSITGSLVMIIARETVESKEKGPRAMWPVCLAVASLLLVVDHPLSQPTSIYVFSHRRLAQDPVWFTRSWQKRVDLICDVLVTGVSFVDVSPEVSWSLPKEGAGAFRY